MRDRASFARRNRARTGSSAGAAVRYTITPSRPQAHLFEVVCRVEHPDPAGQRFSLPAWIPGSYLIREFSRHIVSIRATSGARALAVRKLDKHSFFVEAAPGPVEVSAEIYAFDLSVRGAHLDATHGFFNGSSVFLRVEGAEAQRCEVDIRPPRGARSRDWRVATSMRPRGAAPHGFGTYQAQDYDELIDHPVEMGRFSLAGFRACGVPHEVAISGRHRGDLARICRDLKRVCEQHIRMFGEPAPMQRYLFLVTAIGEGYGGLEHRASTALLCARDDLPRLGEAVPGERYRTFLGLCSHEYFHAWNVKRLRPAEFTPYDLDRENYTRQLWAFEGVTSYYDDLALVRSGLVSRRDYLEILARTITDHLRTPGRRRQSLAESSFDAWIKYYRQDENSPNAGVSYYRKGSLVALCLDLLIRSRSDGRRSLDDAWRLLWRRHGVHGAGVEEGALERAIEAAAGFSLRRTLDAWLRSTAELPLARLLAGHGITLALRAAQSAGDKGGTPAPGAGVSAGAALGMRTRAEGKDLVVTHVMEAGAAQAAGISAGDVIAAVDGIRAGPGGLDEALAGRRTGQSLQFHVFRRDELMAMPVLLGRAPRDTCVLQEAPAAGRARELRERWLGMPSRRGRRR